MLKHLCQIAIIEKLKEKDKGFTYIDTHSGAGLYKLDSEQALKTKEFNTGISRLDKLELSDSLLARYLDITKGYGDYVQYPGSPELARQLLREQDELILMEWHNTEVQNLKNNLHGKNIAIHHRDGFEGLVAVSPPKLKRGLVLIDPSYELTDDYQSVVEAVTSAYQRWPTATYAIWYPLIAQRDNKDTNFSGVKGKAELSQNMLEVLSKQSFGNLLNVQLLINKKEQGQGMYGSGMLVVNAPWKFEQTISQSLQQILPFMADNDQASMQVNWLIQPT